MADWAWPVVCRLVRPSQPGHFVRNAEDSAEKTTVYMVPENDGGHRVTATVSIGVIVHSMSPALFDLHTAVQSTSQDHLDREILPGINHIAEYLVAATFTPTKDLERTVRMPPLRFPLSRVAGFVTQHLSGLVFTLEWV